MVCYRTARKFLKVQGYFIFIYHITMLFSLFQDPSCFNLLHFWVSVMPQLQLKYLKIFLLIQSFLIYLRSESDLSQFCLYKNLPHIRFLGLWKMEAIVQHWLRETFKRIGQDPKTYFYRIHSSTQLPILLPVVFLFKNVCCWYFMVSYYTMHLWVDKVFLKKEKPCKSIFFAFKFLCNCVYA